MYLELIEAGNFVMCKHRYFFILFLFLFFYYYNATLFLSTVIV